MSINNIINHDSRLTKVGESEWNRTLWIVIADFEPGSHRQDIHDVTL